MNSMYADSLKCDRDMEPDDLKRGGGCTKCSGLGYTESYGLKDVGTEECPDCVGHEPPRCPECLELVDDDGDGEMACTRCDWRLEYK